MTNIHASCVSYFNQGILIYGKSGLGKSDLSLRLIMDKGARLVADDRVEIYKNQNELKAKSVATIAGLLEVRGVGLCRFDYLKSTTIKLAVELVKSQQDVERLPERKFFEYEGIKVQKIKLYAFEPSAPDKVILALNQKDNSY